MAYRILVFGSVPLAAPWNGADKNLARLLVQADPHNQFVVQTSLDEPWPPLPHVLAIREKKADSMPTVAQKLRALAYLLRYTGGVDLIHVVASLKTPARWSASLLRAWPVLHRKPIIHTVPSVGDIPIHRQNFPGDMTVVISEHTRQLLTNEGVPNVTRVYPPVDEQHLHPARPPSEVAQMLGLGPRAVLYPAHYGPQSGISEIIEAFACLPASLNDAILVLACRTHPGQDPKVEAARTLAQAAAAGIAERIRITGVVPDMPALIAACAVTALVPGKLASKMDLPLVVLESLVLERPVIVSDKPPMNEALLGGGGIAVPYQNQPALTKALIHLLSDEELRGRLGRQGRKAVLEQCQPASIVAHYQGIYQSIVEMYKS